MKKSFSLQGAQKDRIRYIFQSKWNKICRAFIFRENQINQYGKEDINALNPIKKSKNRKKNKRKRNTQEINQKSVLYDIININRKFKLKKKEI